MCRFKWLIAVGSIVFALIFLPSVNAETKKGENKVISSGKKVSIEYTLKLKDQSVVDTNVGSAPLTYVHGSHQVIPGLEKELEGMKIGENKHVTVSPEEGYGTVNEKAVLELSKDKITTKAPLKVGARLQGRNAGGQVISATIKEIKDKTVVLDHNHPLAGKTLYFDVKVLDIQ